MFLSKECTFGGVPRASRARARARASCAASSSIDLLIGESAISSPSAMDEFAFSPRVAIVENEMKPLALDSSTQRGSEKRYKRGEGGGVT